MTLRSVIIGLLGVTILCSVSYINDIVLHQTFIIGSGLPVGIFGVVILYTVLINPLLFRLRPSWALRGSELAVILFCVLAVCCLPGSGLMRHFTRDLLLPFHWQQADSSWWQGVDATHHMPSYMLTKVTPENENRVLNAFIQPDVKRDATLRQLIAAVPWDAWRATCKFWMPFILIFLIGLLGLTAVVHRQWADHEQLPYPIAKFAAALLPEGGSLAGVFRKRIFWLAALVPFLYHMNNYAAVWQSFVGGWMRKFPLYSFGHNIDFSSLGPMAHTLMAGGGGTVLNPRFDVTVMAIAFLLASDVSFSVGIAWPAWCLLVGTFAGYGYALNGGDPNPSTFLSAGAWIGMFLIIIVIGRTYYRQVFAHALGFRGQPAPPEAVWGARIFLLCMTGFVVYVSIFAHLEWQLVLLYTLGMIVIFLVMGRIIAETGFFLVSPAFDPGLMLAGLLGAFGLGPSAVLKMGMFTQALLVDPRETFTPFIMTGWKLLDEHRVSLVKVLKIGVVAIILGLLVVFPMTLFYQYTRGENMVDAWAAHWAVWRPFSNYIHVYTHLDQQGMLAQSLSLHGWQHFSQAIPQGRAVLWLLVGLSAILVCMWGRLRFPRWILHPVFFLVWNTWPLPHLWASFLVGWVAKALVVRYGGNNLYRAAIPLVFGLIAGELLAGVVTIIIGELYFLITKQPPPQYYVLFS